MSTTWENGSCIAVRANTVVVRGFPIQRWWYIRLNIYCVDLSRNNSGSNASIHGKCSRCGAPKVGRNWLAICDNTTTILGFYWISTGVSPLKTKGTWLNLWWSVLECAWMCLNVLECVCWRLRWCALVCAGVYVFYGCHVIVNESWFIKLWK